MSSHSGLPASTRVPEGPPRLLRCGLIVVVGLGWVCRGLLLIWGTFAIYWSNLPWWWMRMLAAVMFLLLGGWLLIQARSGRHFTSFGVLFLMLLAWWASIQPSHHRPWKKEVAVLPIVTVEGDKVALRNVRNFHYRSVSDFDVRYEDRMVNLSKLSGVDFFVSKWSDAPIAHTFVSFVFEDTDPVCISIEARLEEGEVYSALASCFKQVELIYVIGEERDIVGVRAHHRNERVWRYQTTTSPEGARAFFLSYLERINRLAEEPEFYHLLSNNCTTNIARHSSPGNRGRPFDLRLLVNGWVDAYAYALGLLDVSVPLEALRQRSEVTSLARDSALDEGFSARIRHR